MWYRTTVWTHTRRVRNIARRVSPIIAARTGVRLDQDLAEAMCTVHDDIELIIGDVQAGDKSKMTAEELEELAHREQDAIETLVDRFPKTVGPYSYRDLLIRVHERQGPESWAQQFADKLDGFGEGMHELFAGNPRFATAVSTQFGELPLPCDYYTRYFREKFARLFPEVRFLVEGPDALITVPERTDSPALARNGSRHTVASLQRPTGFQPYDFWRETILAADEAEQTLLLTQTREE